jgi:RNA polymerase sigma-70 factor (ECF subfamily)
MPADGPSDPTALSVMLVRHLPWLQACVRLRVGPELRAYESCSDLVQSVCGELAAAQGGLTFADEAAFRGWLFTTALNKVRARARHLHRQRRDVRRLVAGTAGAELAARQPALEASPSATAALGEQIERLEAAFDVLSEDHREVILLARFAGLPLREVGVRMGGRSPAAVTMLLGRALAALDRALGGAAPPPGARDGHRRDGP